jgi:hypothetical protein
MPSIRTVDNNTNVGIAASLALTSGGFPVIAYHDNKNFDVKLAVCMDATCGGSTTIRTVVSSGDVGRPSAVVLRSNIPALAYYDAGLGDLGFDACGDLTCSVGNVKSLAQGDVGSYFSMALFGTVASVAYYDKTNGVLRLANCADAPCTSVTTLLVDQASNVGQYVSLAIGQTNGYFSMAYYDATNKNLRMSVCTSSTCTVRFVTVLDSSSSDVGKGTSITLTTAQFPVISYFDSANAQLKLCVCSNTGCTAFTTTVIATSNAGAFSSVALTPLNIPVISYSMFGPTAAVNSLWIAFCVNTTCT